jgi:hypothetical protein
MKNNKVDFRRKAILYSDGYLIFNKNYSIDKIAIRANTAQTLTIGTTIGGDEVMLEDTLIPNKWMVLDTEVIPIPNEKIILYFTGITNRTHITVYYSKL